MSNFDVGDRDEDGAKGVSTIVDIDGPLAQLRQAISEKNTDRWAMGTVIRWEADSDTKVFLYSAIKTPVGWCTSSRRENGWVPTVVAYDDLVEILARSETQNAQVATTWETVG